MLVLHRRQQLEVGGVDAVLHLADVVQLLAFGDGSDE
jgi:hypothetical protein